LYSSSETNPRKWGVSNEAENKLGQFIVDHSQPCRSEKKLVNTWHRNLMRAKEVQTSSQQSPTSRLELKTGGRGEEQQQLSRKRKGDPRIYSSLLCCYELKKRGDNSQRFEDITQRKPKAPERGVHTGH